MTAVLRPRMRTILSLSLFCYSLFVISAVGEAASLSGRVTDPDGRAVANAEVIVTGAAAAPLRARSDSDGKFVFAELDAGPLSRHRQRAGPRQRRDADRRRRLAGDARHHAAHQRDRGNAGRLGGADRSAAVAHARQRHRDSRRRDRRQAAVHARLGAAIGARPDAAAERRPRHGDVALHPRRRIGLHAGAGRRHSRQRLRRRPRPVAGAAAGCRAHRGGPRTAERALRIGRHRRRDQRHHAHRRHRRRPRRRSKPAAATCCAHRARPPARSTACAGSSAPTTSRTPASPAPPRTARPCRTTMRRRRRRRHRSAGGTPTAAPICRARCSTSTPSADRPGRTDPIPPTATPASTPSRAARPSASAAASRWMQPWFGASSRVRQRIEFDVADYDLSFKSQFGVSDGNTHRSHARVQTDVSANAEFGFSGGFEWLGERGGSTFITSGPTSAPTPVERGVLGIFGEGRWNAGDRATITAGIRGERITRDALPGDPLAFQPRPDFPEETINSVNPKIAASFRRRATGTRLRGIVRHRHPPARCVRDRLHRQFGTEAGAQQERRIRRDADVRRRRRATRRAPRSSIPTPT